MIEDASDSKIREVLIKNTVSLFNCCGGFTSTYANRVSYILDDIEKSNNIIVLYFNFFKISKLSICGWNLNKPSGEICINYDRRVPKQYGRQINDVFYYGPEGVLEWSTVDTGLAKTFNVNDLETNNKHLILARFMMFGEIVTKTLKELYEDQL